MRKDRFGRYLPIMTAVTAIAFTTTMSNVQSTREKADSAVSSTAEEAKPPVADEAYETPNVQAEAKKVAPVS
jgi:hypothetical protein